MVKLLTKRLQISLKSQIPMIMFNFVACFSLPFRGTCLEPLKWSVLYYLHVQSKFFFGTHIVNMCYVEVIICYYRFNLQSISSYIN